MYRSIFQLIVPLLLLLPITASAKNYPLGPVGGTGGYYFKKTVASHERVCGVYVRHGARIDAIQLKICDSSGNSYRSQRFGGSGGNESFFPIYSNEYLSAMIVYPGYYKGSQRVFGLALYKNKIGSTSSSTEVTSGLYGSQTYSTPKSLDPYRLFSPGIIGIWGRAGGELDAIGTVVSQSQIDNNPGITLANAVGGAGGSNINIVSQLEKVCKIDIRHGSVVDALRFKDCKSDGSTQYSPWYGGTGGSLSSFTLQSNEYLTAIRGSLINSGGKTIFSSVYFVTNLRTSAVYGQTSTRTFSIDIPSSRQSLDIGFRYSTIIYRMDVRLH